MFGHLADSQTVCSRLSCTSRYSFEYASPPGIFIFSQDGLRPAGCTAGGESEITLSGRGITARFAGTKERGDETILGATAHPGKRHPREGEAPSEPSSIR